MGMSDTVYPLHSFRISWMEANHTNLYVDFSLNSPSAIIINLIYLWDRDIFHDIHFK